MGIYGLINKKATTTLIAMVAMLFTAINYDTWRAANPLPAWPTLM
jgi:hypothetical protein